MIPVGVNAENVIDFRARYGPIQYCRVFLQTQNFSLNDARIKEALAAQARGEKVVITMKVSSVPNSGAADDTRQASILNGLIAAGLRDFIWGVYHEPEDDVANGTFTAVQWRAMQNRMLPKAKAIIAGVGGRTAIILMSYTANSKSGRNIDDYKVDVADLVGFDIYEKAGSSSGDGTSWATKDPSTMPVDEKDSSGKQIGLWGMCIDVAHHWNKPWLAPEFGCLRRQTDTAGTERGAYFRKVAASPRIAEALAIVYYEVGPPRFNYAFRTEAAGISGFKTIGAAGTVIPPVDPGDPCAGVKAQLAAAQVMITDLNSLLVVRTQERDEALTDLAEANAALDASNQLVTELQPKADKYDSIEAIVNS